MALGNHINNFAKDIYDVGFRKFISFHEGSESKRVVVFGDEDHEFPVDDELFERYNLRNTFKFAEDAHFFLKINTNLDIENWPPDI